MSFWMRYQAESDGHILGNGGIGGKTIGFNIQLHRAEVKSNIEFGLRIKFKSKLLVWDMKIATKNYKLPAKDTWFHVGLTLSKVNLFRFDY